MTTGRPLVSRALPLMVTTPSTDRPSFFQRVIVLAESVKDYLPSDLPPRDFFTVRSPGRRSVDDHSVVPGKATRRTVGSGSFEAGCACAGTDITNARAATLTAASETLNDFMPREFPRFLWRSQKHRPIHGEHVG